MSDKTNAPNHSLQIVSSISDIDAEAWNHLAGDNPFVAHQFLLALEQTGCTTRETGWQPRHLALYENEKLIGAMPLYLKFHSYGEYVFDWAWADAYERSGLKYYPKLLSAIPFTPVTGPRLLANTKEPRSMLVRGALALAQEMQVSSLHCLLPTDEQANEMAQLGMMRRDSVQFHWRNQNYSHFEQFLADMNQEKRKKIRQERKKISTAGVTFRWLRGDAIRSADWDFFTQCYNHTYRMHRSTPYLNREFFACIGTSMAPSILLIFAERNGVPIAAALNIHNAHHLYGRYWGALEYLPGLHFEACYYQAIEFCIEEKIQVFEGGAQGEHKLARGLLPVKTASTHWLAQPEFAKAVENYLHRESGGVEKYIDELGESSPFKIDARARGIF
ncbi:MAG: GNAT family N-acetyltransferase [Burkholderiales bacterium]